MILAGALLVAACSGLLAGCSGGASASVHPELAAVLNGKDAVAISDALEKLIEEGKDTPTDREKAYQAVQSEPGDTAAGAFARAAVTGRLVQQRGLRAGLLVAEVERFARKSKELDPNFRNGMATQMLGSLYVLAPAALLKHGDSEEGLSLLEGLVEAHPEIPEYHLRVAEAYIALGDPTPARPYLCTALSKKASLRRDEQALLEHLVADGGGKDTLECDADHDH